MSSDSKDIIVTALYCKGDTDIITSIRPIRKSKRKKLTQKERDFIWASTNGRCYLCKKILVKSSSWHIEHVIAFSKDPDSNDLLGNMLPSCPSCNLRKNDVELVQCIAKDSTFDLATDSKDIPHLNTFARDAIVVALKAKLDRKLFQDGGCTDVVNRNLGNVLDEIDRNIALGADLFSNRNRKSFIASSCLPYEIDSSSILYSKETVHGHGSFGEVYPGKYCCNSKIWKAKVGSKPSKGAVESVTGTNQGEIELGSYPSEVCINVAIKIPTSNRHDVLESLQSEISILTRVRHAHIVTFYGWFKVNDDEAKEEEYLTEYDNCSHMEGMRNSSSDYNAQEIVSMYCARRVTIGEIGLVLEWCSHSLNLTVAMENIDPKLVFYDISCALEYLHSKSYLHRDVKPSNILIHHQEGTPWSQACAKLCDFGSAKLVLNEDGGHTCNAGTASFRPPESRNGKCTAKSDVYSLGKSMAWISTMNKRLLRERHLREQWDSWTSQMTLEYPAKKRPDMSAVCLLLNPDHVAVPFEPAVDEEKTATNNSPPSSPSKRKPRKSGGGEGPCGVRHIDRDRDKLMTLSPCTAPCPMSSGSPQSPEWVVAGGISQEAADVYLTIQSRCARKPTGSKLTKYHSSSGCGNIVGRELMTVSESEARLYGHKRCKVCRWTGCTSPSRETAGASPPGSPRQSGLCYNTVVDTGAGTEEARADEPPPRGRGEVFRALGVTKGEGTNNCSVEGADDWSLSPSSLDPGLRPPVPPEPIHERNNGEARARKKYTCCTIF